MIQLPFMKTLQSELTSSKLNDESQFYDAFLKT